MCLVLMGIITLVHRVSTYLDAHDLENMTEEQIKRAQNALKDEFGVTHKKLIIFPMNYVEVSLVYTFSLGIACYDYILLVGRRVVVTWWWEESNILRMESVLTQVASV